MASIDVDVNADGKLTIVIDGKRPLAIHSRGRLPENIDT
eukprot:CAMPEP_0169138328 /NCGR_PEP_ID=MMETSP1015-20121227/42158_1 /TAXON_ID=342587 /ORGANISM="Karlodinium micrum, Strain CCMP2283" /LENGTH=38 /DNA_ID= /DNA_START= /DNA_END= /DNA_ORIENTATION=